MSNNQFDKGNVKVFGFRSGKSYKMIPAMLYYIIVALIIVPSIFGEFRFFEFEPIDYPCVVIKYVFITVGLFSPLIFLSDFNYVYKIPLFRKKEFGASLLGILIVTAFCYFMYNVEIYVASDTYKESRTIYYIENTKESVVTDKKKADSDTLKGRIFEIRDADGYKVQVSVDDKADNLIYDSEVKTSKLKIKNDKFKNQKTMYVRVRAFYKGKKKTYLSKWSDFSKVTIKK